MSGAYEGVAVIRPLTVLSLQAGEWLGVVTGEQIHVVNIVLHLAAAALVLETLRRLIPMRAAEFAAVIFALHPIQAELADAVASRAAVLAGLLCLVCLWEWVRGRCWWSVLWLALAIAAREDAAVFPLALVLLHVSGKRSEREWRPLAVMTGIGLGWAVVVMTARGWGSGWKPMLAALQFVFAPVDLARMDVDVAWAGALAALACVVVGALAFRGVHAGYWTIAGLCLLAGGSVLLPAARGGYERHAYVAMIGFAGAMGVVSQGLRRMWLLPIALGCAALTVQRQDAWKSSEPAARAEVVKTSQVVESARKIGSAVKAVRVLEQAQKDAPEDTSIARELAGLYLKLGRYLDSLRESDRVLARAPEDRDALASRAAVRQEYEGRLRSDPCSVDALVGLARLGVRVQPPEGCVFTAEQRRALGL